MYKRQELRDVTASEPFYIEADSPAIQACINTYNEVTGENAKPFTMGGHQSDTKSGLLRLLPRRIR